MSTASPRIHVLRLGRMAYEDSAALMMRLVDARMREEIPDVLLMVEHDPVITLGRGGDWEDIPLPPDRLSERGVRVIRTDRGGRATYHGPGQLVVYPILQVQTGVLYHLIGSLEDATIRTLAHWGVEAGKDPELPGVWIGENKIAAVGLAVRDHITYHGLALNVSTDLTPFEWIIPCGIVNRGVTSLKNLTASSPPLEAVAQMWMREWAKSYGTEWEWGFQTGPWLVAAAPGGPETDRLYHLLRTAQLHTVCEEALCPNLGECWEQSTATFMLSGDICTRHCRFCAVASGHPNALSEQEPQNVADAVQELALDYVVLTSVARDDLEDGGARQFAHTIHAIRQKSRAAVEVLIPDFAGSRAALDMVLQARPDVLNHNIETVPRLYPRIVPRKRYDRSLGVLEYAKHQGFTTKAGLILGMGETRGEVLSVLRDLRKRGCDLLTLGQYLPPSESHWLVEEYIHPAEFLWYKECAEQMGFRGVVAGPLVRSSYHASDLSVAALGGRLPSVLDRHP